MKLYDTRSASLILLLLFITNVVVVTSAFTFDGKRKGLVLGLGLGFSPLAHLSASHESTNKVGLGGNFIIGYGVGLRDVLAFEANLTDYYPEYGSNYGLREPRAVQGIAAISWYRYFGPVGHACFIMGGTGIYRAKEYLHGIYINVCFGPECPEPEIKPSIPQTWGFGMMMGAGRELSRHFQATLYLSGGFPRGYFGEEQGTKVTNLAAHVNLLLTWISF
jgi:hypothetical protein